MNGYVLLTFLLSLRISDILHLTLTLTHVDMSEDLLIDKCQERRGSHTYVRVCCHDVKCRYLRAYRPTAPTAGAPAAYTQQIQLGVPNQSAEVYVYK